MVVIVVVVIEKSKRDGGETGVIKMVTLVLSL